MVVNRSNDLLQIKSQQKTTVRKQQNYKKTKIL